MASYSGRPREERREWRCCESCEQEDTLKRSRGGSAMECNVWVGVPKGQCVLGRGLAKYTFKHRLSSVSPLHSTRGRQQPAPTQGAKSELCRRRGPRSQPHQDDFPWDRGG